MESSIVAIKLAIETCNECGGDVKIITSIEDPVVIRKILAHLDVKTVYANLLPACRAPPGMALSTEVYNLAGPDWVQQGLHCPVDSI